MGRIGATAGGLLFAGLALHRGARPWLVLAIIAVDLAGFVAWGWITTRWRHRRRYVLIEHALIACGAMMGLVTLADADVVGIADAWIAGIALTLGIGRVGCLFMGCCHGRAARTGVRYRWLPPWILGDRWDPLRLFPIQAVEAAGLVALSVTGVALTLTSSGWSATAIPAGYAVLRFELELWRGDARRYIRRLSHNQWSCLLVVALTSIRPAVGLSAAVLIAALAIVQRARLRPPAWIVSSPADLAMLEVAVVRTLGGTTSYVAGARVDPDGHGSLRLIPRAPRIDDDLALVVALAVEHHRADGSRRERPVGDRS